MRRLFCLAIATMFVLCVGLCWIATASDVNEVPPEKAYKMVKQEPNFYILDVRTPCEWYWVGHPGEEICTSECGCNEAGCSPGCKDCEECPWPKDDETVELKCEYDEDTEKWTGMWIKKRGSFLNEKVIHIPWWLYDFVPKTQEYDSEDNKFFDEEVLRRFDPDIDTLILMCRSGTRSGEGCVEIGTKKAYTHPAHKRLEKLGYFNVFNMIGGFEGGKDECGYRTVNGWKNAELPYNYSKTGMWVPYQKGRSLN